MIVLLVYSVRLPGVDILPGRKVLGILVYLVLLVRAVSVEGLGLKARWVRRQVLEGLANRLLMMLVWNVVSLIYLVLRMSAGVIFDVRSRSWGSLEVPTSWKVVITANPLQMSSHRFLL